MHLRRVPPYKSTPFTEATSSITVATLCSTAPHSPPPVGPSKEFQPHRQRKKKGNLRPTAPRPAPCTAPPRRCLTPRRRHCSPSERRVSPPHPAPSRFSLSLSPHVLPRPTAAAVTHAQPPLLLPASPFLPPPSVASDPSRTRRISQRRLRSRLAMPSVVVLTRLLPQ